MTILPDVLQADLTLVFCGTAASDVSAREGAYYANPTNYFWRTLYDVGLIPVRLPAAQFRQLPRYGIGLTDLVKHAQGNDSDLRDEDYDVERLRQNIATYRPQILAFTSKKAASVVLQRPTGKIDYGLQATTLGDTTLWVLTSPSGSARRYWDIAVWQGLADYIAGMDNLP